jgi:hypothetical protein
MTPGVDIPTVTSYNASGWRTDMWRGGSFHALVVVLLALQFPLPPSWVKHGLECFQRCRLAAPTGAHCPLMYGARQSKTHQHCQDRTSAVSPLEWRSHCAPVSPSLSSLDAPRFVLPQSVILIAFPFTQPCPVEPVVLLRDSFLTPPDPPPRTPSLRLF